MLLLPKIFGTFAVGTFAYNSLSYGVNYGRIRNKNDVKSVSWPFGMY
jgi:hypothetical protein